MRHRKQTAWKKSRTQGQVYGGRTHRMRGRGLFRRLHGLRAPAPGAETPILIEENASRDFFFPLDGRECLQALRALPADDCRGLTHLCLRRPTRDDRDRYVARYIGGAGVFVIVVHAWRSDRRYCFGPGRPIGRFAAPCQLQGDCGSAVALRHAAGNGTAPLPDSGATRMLMPLPVSLSMLFAITAAAQIPMAPILGTVTTPDGAPAAGAQVTVSQCDGRLFRCLDVRLRDEWREVARLRTDARGRFAAQVPLGLALRVDVDLAPYALWRDQSVVPGEPLEVKLGTACTLSGRLVDPTSGQGTPGLLRAWEPGTQVERWRGQAAADGSFRFERVAPGRFVCDVEPDVCAAPAWIEGELAAGANVKVAWPCAVGEELRGTVTDAATGAPLAGARVGLGWWFGREVRTDANGHYLLRGFGGGPVVDVHADAPGYQRHRSDQATLPAGPRTVDFALQPGVKVVGRLVDADGKAIAGAYVAAIAFTGPEIPWLATRSDAAGHFTCDGLPRRSEGLLMVRCVGFASVVYSLPSAAGDGQIDFGAIVLRRPELVQGVLLDVDKKPAAGVEISLRGVNSDMNRLANTPTTWGTLRIYCGERLARTDAAGRFAFGDVPPGQYDVAIGSYLESTNASESIEVVAGKHVPVLRLER